MIDQMQQAQAIKSILQSGAAHHLWAMLDEMVADDTNNLIGIIAKRPDTLTGKTAIRLASRAQALKDFKEAVLDTQKILEPSTRKGRE